MSSQQLAILLPAPPSSSSALLQEHKTAHSRIRLGINSDGGSLARYVAKSRRKFSPSSAARLFSRPSLSKFCELRRAAPLELGRRPAASETRAIEMRTSSRPSVCAQLAAGKPLVEQTGCARMRTAAADQKPTGGRHC